MTKKDYELIALAIWEARQKAWTDEDIDNVQAILARKLSEQNPRFNRAMFEAACNGR